MTKIEFLEELERMRETYGEKAYPKERADILFEKLKWLEPLEFRAIVSELIANNAHAPMLGKFEEVTRAFKQKNSARSEEAFQAWLSTQPWCDFCGRQGFILARLRGDTITAHPFAFRCSCDIGERAAFKYPLWSEARHGSRYSREKPSEPPPPMSSSLRPNHNIVAFASHLVKSMPLDPDDRKRGDDDSGQESFEIE